MSRCLSLAIPSHTLRQHQQSLRLKKKERKKRKSSRRFWEKGGLCSLWLHPSADYGCTNPARLCVCVSRVCVCLAVGFHVYKHAYLCVGEWLGLTLTCQKSMQLLIFSVFFQSVNGTRCWSANKFSTKCWVTLGGIRANAQTLSAVSQTQCAIEDAHQPA